MVGEGLEWCIKKVTVWPQARFLFVFFLWECSGGNHMVLLVRSNNISVFMSIDPIDVLSFFLCYLRCLWHSYLTLVDIYKNQYSSTPKKPLQ